MQSCNLLNLTLAIAQPSDWSRNSYMKLMTTHVPLGNSCDYIYPRCPKCPKCPNPTTGTRQYWAQLAEMVGGQPQAGLIVVGPACQRISQHPTGELSTTPSHLSDHIFIYSRITWKCHHQAT